MKGNLKRSGQLCYNIMKLIGEIFLVSFYDQQMYDDFCSNSDCVILFFLGAWVCVEYKEKMTNSNLYWELKNS